MTGTDCVNDQAFGQGKPVPVQPPLVVIQNHGSPPSDKPDHSGDKRKSPPPANKPETERQKSIVEAFEELEPDEKLAILEHLNRMIGRT